jgi:hypothetical protein
MTEIDRLNLMQAAQENPSKAIVFDGGFLDGEDKKPFGFVPNDWDGWQVNFHYLKKGA